MLRNPGLRKSVEQPVLDLNFAAAQIGSNGAPDSRIDFSRGNNAWFVDSDGLVKKSPHNLLLQSEDFGTTWSAIGDVTVATNEIVAPDGTTTADKISSANFAAGGNHIRQGSGTIDAGTYTASVFVKAGSLDTFKFRIVTFAPSTLDANSVFDLSTGEWTSINANHTVSTEAYPNDWFRLSLTFSNPASGAVQPRFAASSGSGFIYLWGAQLSQHTTLPVGNPYIKTEGSAAYAARLDHDPAWFMSAAQEQNLLEYSEMLDNSGWTKYQSTVTANAAVAPDGTTTAEKLASSNTLEGAVIQDVEGNPSVTYVFSIYLKKDEFDEAELHLNYRGGGSSLYRAIYDVDLTAGTIAYQAGSTATTTITDDGDGWFRVTISQPSPASTDTVRAEVNAPVGNASGDGILVWGAQLEVGTSPGTYHRTEGAPYYGEGATPKGLLIEEQRANAVPYSEDLSASGLNPGISPANSVTITSNAALAPDGTNTATKLVAASASGNSSHIAFKIVFADNDTDVAASVFMKDAGQRWAYLQLGNTGYASAKTAFVDLQNGVLGVSDSSAAIEDYGNGWYRVSLTNTTDSDGGNDVFAIGLAEDDNDVTFTGDDTNGIFVWGLQQENGVTFPTSYIQTTGSTATRNADVAVMGPTVAPDKLGTELIVDGDFPSLDNFSQAGTGNFSVSGGILEVEPTSGNFQRVYQSVPTEIGKRYRASVFARTESASDAASLWAGTAALGGDSTAYGKVSQSTSNFLEKTIDFTATTTSAFIAVGDNGAPTTTDSHFFHTLSLKEILPGTELVTNGTFDTDVSDWVEFNANSSITYDSGAAIISSNQYNDVRQVLSLVEGRRYRASMDVITRTSGAWFFLLAHDSTNTNVQGGFADGSTQTFDFTAGAVNTLRIYPYTTTNPDTIKVDNISVRELYPFEQYNPAEGTLYSESESSAEVLNSCVFVITDGTNNERVEIRHYGSTTGASRMEVVDGGVAQASISPTQASDFRRNALAYKANSANAAGDGVSGTEDTTVSVPSPDEVLIGGSTFNVDYTGHIKQLSYYPRRLSDEALENLTSD